MQEYRDRDRRSDNWEDRETFQFETDFDFYDFTFDRLDERYNYSYRVITNLTEFNKLTDGGISPESIAVQPLCISTALMNFVYKEGWVGLFYMILRSLLLLSSAYVAYLATF